jgi:hypothetical protein
MFPPSKLFHPNYISFNCVLFNIPWGPQLLIAPIILTLGRLRILASKIKLNLLFVRKFKRALEVRIIGAINNCRPHGMDDTQNCWMGHAAGNKFTK